MGERYHLDDIPLRIPSRRGKSLGSAIVLFIVGALMRSGGERHDLVSSLGALVVLVAIGVFVIGLIRKPGLVLDKTGLTERLDNGQITEWRWSEITDLAAPEGGPVRLRFTAARRRLANAQQTQGLPGGEAALMSALPINSRDLLDLLRKAHARWAGAPAQPPSPAPPATAPLKASASPQAAPRPSPRHQPPSPVAHYPNVVEEGRRFGRGWHAPKKQSPLIE